MSRVAYNISLLIALVLIGVGSGAQWGWSIASIVIGALVILLTLVGAWLSASAKG